MLRTGQVHPDVEAWLDRNAAACELIHRASRKPRFYMPVITAYKPSAICSVLLPPLQKYRSVAKLLQVRALFRMHRGDVTEAWQDMLALHRLARLIDQHPSLVAQMVAVGVDGIASQTGISLATQKTLPDAKKHAILRELASLRPIGRTVEIVDKCERFFVLDTTAMISRQGGLAELRKMQTGPVQPDNVKDTILSLAQVDWNQMLRAVNEHYNRLGAALRETADKGKQARDDAISTVQARCMKRSAKRGNPILLAIGGRLFRTQLTSVFTDTLLFVLTPSLIRCCEMQDRGRIQHDIETIAVALACYHAEHGRRPDKLEDLTPKLVKTIPPDPFTAGPLTYKPRPDGYLLYSVGMDLIDDGGRKEREPVDTPTGRRKMDDIAAQVPPPAPKTMPAEQ